MIGGATNNFTSLSDVNFYDPSTNTWTSGTPLPGPRLSPVAGLINGISGAHRAFLNAGGRGILVGDGQLPNPGTEKIAEIYYSFPLFAWRATLDYQLIVNPAYNRDRGPVSVVGTRLHAQF